MSHKDPSELELLNKKKWQQQGTLDRVRALIKATLRQFPRIQSHEADCLIQEFIREKERIQFEYEEKRRELPSYKDKPRIRTKKAKT